MNDDTWCIVMGSRHAVNGAIQDSVLTSLRLASTVSSVERTATVFAGARNTRNVVADGRPALGHLIVQPEYRGTAFEVLLALLWLERHCEKSQPVVFLPCDYIVSDEAAMTASLREMVDWIASDPEHVYLLGTLPQESPGSFGYIVPWNDSWHVPASVYEFVESPDARLAQRLIHAGALLNTFIFGGSVSTLLSLFSERFGQLIPHLHATLRAQQGNTADDERLRAIYARLINTDFSKDVLASQTDKLKVFRMANCGWRPAHTVTHISTAAVSRP